MQDPSLCSQIRSLVQPQPQFPDQEHLKCPRCDSENTKFCYYNNYNLSQPRHYCKNCKRYWTKGGALRNIPVGGGSRKNTKRSSSAAAHSHQSKRPATTASASNNSKLMGDASVIRGLLPLEGDNYAGQFGNFLDGANEPGLQLRSHFRDPGSGPGHDTDHRVGIGSGSGRNTGDGFLNGGSGLWLT